MRRWLRALGALVLLALILVGVPFVLATIAGWPLPRSMPDWDRVLRMVRQGEIPAEPVIKALGVVAWLAWAQVAWAVLWELAVNVPAQVSGRPVRAGAPLVASPVSSAVGRLVAVILAVGVLTATTPAAARAPLSSTPVDRPGPGIELVHDAAIAPATANTGRAHIESEQRWLVTAADTMWDIAETVFGDGSRVGELLELNPHVGSARNLRPGQVIVVPSDAQVPESRRPTTQPAFAAGEPEPAASTHTITFDAGADAVKPASGSIVWSSHTVAPGDSVYAIAAEVVAHDGRSVGEVADQIVERNLGRTMHDGRVFSDPSLIFPGWRLDVPLVANAPAPAPPAAPAERSATAAAHVVAPGDSYWSIAEAHLRSIGGDTSPVNVTALVEEIRATNAPILGHADPNMIHPGEVVLLPGTGVDVAPVAAVAPVAPAAEVPAEAAEAPGSTPETPPVDSGDTPPESLPTPVPDVPIAADAPAPAPAAEPAPRVSTPTAPAVPTPQPTAPAPVPAEAPTAPARTGAPTSPTAEEVLGRPSSAPAVGLGATILLAAGALGVLEARRRQQLRRAVVGARLQPPTQTDVETETLLRSLDAPGRALRLDLALRSAAAQLTGSDHFVVGALMLPDGTVTLLLDAPATPPLAPWAAADRDDRWMLAGDVSPLELAPSARRAAQPCPALVHLGAASDGGTPVGDLFVDLEAIGVLCLDVPAAHAEPLERSLAASLCASPLGETLRVVTAGVDRASHLGNLNAESADTLEEATDVASGVVSSTVAALSGGRTFAARAAGLGGEAWEPVVVVVGSTGAGDERLGQLVGLAGEGGRGLGLVIDRRVEGSRWVVRRSGVEEGDGGAFSVDPLGLDVALAGISHAELHALHDLLDAAERPAHVELHSVEEVVWCDDDAADDADSVEFAEQPWSLMVRVLGQLSVVDRAGASVRFERGKALELVAWLSQHRERPTRTAARTALWDLDVRDATFANVVSDARRAMARTVAPPQGEEWIERTLTEHLPLHPHVVSDADLLRARVEHARGLSPKRTIEVVRPGLALVSDMPFAGTGYLWPDAEGITSSLTLLATGAATELAKAYLALGDVDGVFWATGQGLKVLYGHEELIALRMRAHAHCGDLAGVRNEWEVYERALTADPWSSGEPSPKLVAIRRELLSTG